VYGLLLADGELTARVGILILLLPTEMASTSEEFARTLAALNETGDNATTGPTSGVRTSVTGKGSATSYRVNSLGFAGHPERPVGFSVMVNDDGRGSADSWSYGIGRSHGAVPTGSPDALIPLHLPRRRGQRSGAARQVVGRDGLQQRTAGDVTVQVLQGGVGETADLRAE
jgi:hypothetical protein